LNSANINACLLKHLHDETLDPEAMQRLEKAISDAAKLTHEFQHRLQLEVNISREQTPTIS
jgi:hypothetical protein